MTRLTTHTRTLKQQLHFLLRLIWYRIFTYLGRETSNPILCPMSTCSSASKSETSALNYIHLYFGWASWMQFLWSWCERKEIRSWRSFVAFFLRASIYCSQEILSFTSVGAKQPPHFSPQPEWGEIKMPSAPCTTKGHQRKGKERSHDKGSSNQQKFSNKGTSPP